MSEKKRYIKQKHSNGKVLISDDVVATIVTTAIKDVDGVAGLSAKPTSDIIEVVGKKDWTKGLRIIIGQNNDLQISCNINIYYGYSVVTTANAVQEAITVALESMASAKVLSVNVNVCGIIRK